MEHLLTIVVGLAVGLWLATRAAWKLSWPWPAQPQPAAIDPTTARVTSDAGTAAAATSLSTRLHSLEAVFSPWPPI